MTSPEHFVQLVPQNILVTALEPGSFLKLERAFSDADPIISLFKNASMRLNSTFSIIEFLLS